MTHPGDAGSPQHPDHDGPGAHAARSQRVEEFLAGVYALHVPSQTERRERRLYGVAIACVVAGVVSIWLGWWGASGTKYVYQEIPYLVSGGIFGLALVFAGAALFAALLGGAPDPLLAGAARRRPAGADRSRR